MTKSYQPKLNIKIHQSKELNIHQKKEYIYIQREREREREREYSPFCVNNMWI